MTWKELNGIFYRITKDKKFKSRTALYDFADVSRSYCIDRIKNHTKEEVGDNILGKLRVVFPEYIPESTESTESTETTKTTMKDEGKPVHINKSDDNEAPMNLTIALELIKDLRNDTSQLGSTIHRQTIMIENLINRDTEIKRDTESKIVKITEDITTRLLSLQDILLQVGTGHQFLDTNELLRELNKRDLEHLPPNRKRKRTDIRTTDM